MKTRPRRDFSRPMRRRATFFSRPPFSQWKRLPRRSRDRRAGRVKEHRAGKKREREREKDRDGDTRPY